MVEIVIGTDGISKTILNEEATKFVEAIQRRQQSAVCKVYRASHIEPVDPILRGVFHLTRKLFGDKGRVSAWTRRWSILWRVNMSPSGGGIIGIYRDRSKAIDAELAWLRRSMFTE